MNKSLFPSGFYVLTTYNMNIKFLIKKWETFRNIIMWGLDRLLQMLVPFGIF